MKTKTIILWILTGLLLFIAVLSIKFSLFQVAIQQQKINQNEKNNFSKKIVILDPKEGSIIKSPQRISGMARGFWFFEASFPIVLTGNNGEVLGSTIATAKTDWMTEDFVMFEANLVFDAKNVKNGFLIFRRDNPSGLPENDEEIKISVNF